MRCVLTALAVWAATVSMVLGSIDDTMRRMQRLERENDINECLTDNGGCGVNSTCYNQPGGYYCQADKQCGFFTTLAMEERFIEITVSGADCLWTLAVPSNGYVQFGVRRGSVHYGDYFSIWTSANSDGSDRQFYMRFQNFGDWKWVIKDVKFIFLVFSSNNVKNNEYKGSTYVRTWFRLVKGFASNCGFKAMLSNEWTNVTTPNYPSDYKNRALCRWVLEAPENSDVQLMIENGATYSNDDVFQVRKSSNLDGSYQRRVAEFSGNVPKTQRYIEDVKLVLIIFKSDRYWTREGLKASLRIVPRPNCVSNLTLSPKWTSISTPSKPPQYPNMVHCVWNLAVPKDYDDEAQFLVNSGILGFGFEFFEVRKSSNVDGSNDISVGQYHDKVIRTQHFLPDVKLISVRYMSDGKASSEGLTTSVRLVRGLKGGGFISTLSSPEVIDTPNYPDAFPEDADSEWNLEVPVGQDVEFLAQPGKMELYYDSFDVTLSKNEDGSKPVHVAQLSGETEKRRWLIRNAKLIMVKFKSRTQRPKTGVTTLFSPLPLSTPTCGFNATLLRRWTNITTPNFPSNYSNNARCRWTFQVPADFDVLLRIEQGSTEFGFDFFEVRKSEQEDGSGDVRIVELHGDFGETRKLIRNAKYLYVYFDSNSDTTGKGLNASLRLVPVAKRLSKLSFENCYDIYRRKRTAYDGVYTIYPFGNSSLAVEVYCDMTNGGYTIIQKRYDGSTYFGRNWANYTSGFGQVDREYWLGLENMHIMTERKKYELRIELEDWQGVQKYAHYGFFHVSEGYEHRIRFADYSGTAGNSFTIRQFQYFSTYDRDQDDSDWANCPERHGNGGWWFRNCGPSCLNGGNWFETNTNEGIRWSSFNDRYYYSLKKSTMKIIPKL